MSASCLPHECSDRSRSECVGWMHSVRTGNLRIRVVQNHQMKLNRTGGMHDLLTVAGFQAMQWFMLAAAIGGDFGNPNRWKNLGTHQARKYVWEYEVQYSVSNPVLSPLPLIRFQFLLP